MFKQNKQVNEMDQWVEERLSDYLDGTLSSQDRARVEAHLQTSEHARAALESLRWTVSLLKQTPAPPLPRQFTLPVTQRAPAKGAAPWLVWGLRGIAAAATAAFVILLVGTLLRQDAVNETAMMQSSAPAQPTVIALAPTNAPATLAPAPAEGNAAGSGGQDVTPLMITVEPPPPTSGLMPITAVPPAAAPPQPKPTQAPGQAQKAKPTAEIAATSILQPTVVALQAPTETAVAAVSDATGNAPEIAPTSESPTEAAMTQRNLASSLEGVVTPQRLQVRTGPGKEYPVLGVLRRGDRVLIIGISQDAEWLAIEYVRRDVTALGWLATPSVQVQGVFKNLPVLPTPTPENTGSPEPTATPTETPTPLPTATSTP